MKKILAMAVVAATLSAAMPVKKAEAGIMFATQANQLFRGQDEVGKVGLFIGVYMAMTGLTVGVRGAGVTLILLDADGNVSKDALASSLSAKYPFVDDASVIANLADTIKDKYAAQKDARGNALVSLSEDETRSILSGADLSENEIARVVQDLK